jgi:hypothetical protein
VPLADSWKHVRRRRRRRSYDFYKGLLLRNHEIKKSDRIRRCTYNTAYDDVL